MVKININNVNDIFVEGTYITTITKAKDGSTHKGISTVKYIHDDDNKNVGIKIKHSGDENNHEDTVYYHFTSEGVISSHASDINASHNSTVTKITSNTVTETGVGFSHSNNSQIKFKKIIKKDTKTGDITTKIYLKDKNGTFNLYRTHVDVLIS
jgi:hypothetical protein